MEGSRFDIEVGLLFSFEGASRGNPGQASFGVGGWWGTWSDGGFQEHGAIMWRGAELGISTNNVAEAQGMAAAVREAVILHFELLEMLAGQAQRSVGTFRYTWAG